MGASTAVMAKVDTVTATAMEPDQNMAMAMVTDKSLQMTALSAPATRGSTRCRTHGRTLPESHDQKGFGYIDQILLLQNGLCALVIKTCASFLKTGEA